MSWAGGGSSHNPDALRILSSVSSDGTILVWNVETPSTPLCKIYLPEWLMSCNFEKREGRLLTVGGLSGKVWIFGL